VAHTISALKAYKQGEKRRLRNRAVKSALRTQMKKVLSAVEKKDQEASQKALVEAYRLLDRAAIKGVIHRNSADRHKARLAAHVNEVKPAPPPAQG
jgi:small subunit ribosomal protein S20